MTIEAEEAPLTILHLDTAVIEKITEARPDLKLAMECIVAKDVSVKMYMVNKMMRDTETTTAKKKEKKPGMCNKSSSLDAINTGWKGLMRSYFWCESGQDGRSRNQVDKNVHQAMSTPKPFNDLENHPPLIWPNKGQKIIETRFA